MTPTNGCPSSFTVTSNERIATQQWRRFVKKKEVATLKKNNECFFFSLQLRFRKICLIGFMWRSSDNEWSWSKTLPASCGGDFQTETDSWAPISLSNHSKNANLSFLLSLSFSHTHTHSLPHVHSSTNSFFILCGALEHYCVCECEWMGVCVSVRECVRACVSVW